ncbi:DNA repair protein RadC [Algoriphagus iocasae]|uniref:DNA repair protein RadC n=1 Tax=Algoriphagus iocasae TaxID=1836499 RepID=A0A841MPE7_9BACT|nr:JAB domain-containing protein [Algoriphagus iocasae]MBB6324508.1 DNA repair protein RadC [Algoriphagus iocasae]
MEAVKQNFKVAEIKLSYHPKVLASHWPKVKSSKDAYKILLENWEEGTINLFEEFKILLLNSGNKVKGIVPISQGGIAGTLVDPKIVFGVALKSACRSIILAHNHPSGNTNPSQVDIALTEKMVKVGKLLDLEVIDHIIVTSNGHYSFADEGMIR